MARRGERVGLIRRTLGVGECLKSSGRAEGVRRPVVSWRFRGGFMAVSWRFHGGYERAIHTSSSSSCKPQLPSPTPPWTTRIDSPTKYVWPRVAACVTARVTAHVTARVTARVTTRVTARWLQVAARVALITT